MNEQKTTTFGVKVTSADSAEFADILATYSRDGESKAEALRRIFAVAKQEQVKGTHPELEKPLRAVEDTISVLIKQINAAVAGQDATIEQLKDDLAAAVEKKNSAIEKLDSIKCDADREVALAKAEAERYAASLAEVQSAKTTAEALAEEKTQSNNLLLRQVQEMEADVAAYRQLQAEVAALREKLLRSEMEKEKAVMEKEKEMYQEIANLKAQLQIMAQ